MNTLILATWFALTLLFAFGGIALSDRRDRS